MKGVKLKLFKDITSLHVIMSAIYFQEHNILHNELTNNGWTEESHNNGKKYIYKYSNVNPYAEFILDYTSPYEIAITVPIPHNSIAYRNIFYQSNITTIKEYLQMHLSNNHVPMM